MSHLRNIIQICAHTRGVLHWLPSREYETVRLCQDEIPENPVIRLSSVMVDGPPPSWWPYTSTVETEEAPDTCPSSVQGANCQSHHCTRCWDEAGNIAYLRH